jgi:hypothetical protein
MVQNQLTVNADTVPSPYMQQQPPLMQNAMPNGRNSGMHGSMDGLDHNLNGLGLQDQSNGGQGHDNAFAQQLP